MIGIVIICVILITFIFLENKLQYIEKLINFFDILSLKKIPKESKGEKKCRATAEQYFGLAFPKIRPKFLKNITGRRMELDCYNKDLKLAIEMNGVQHYKYTPYFHSSIKDFKKQIERDNLKNKLCKDYGIHLITVPYTEKNIEGYLISEFKKFENKGRSLI